MERLLIKTKLVDEEKSMEKNRLGETTRP